MAPHVYQKWLTPPVSPAVSTELLPLQIVPGEAVNETTGVGFTVTVETVLAAQLSGVMTVNVYVLLVVSAPEETE